MTQAPHIRPKLVWLSQNHIFCLLCVTYFVFFSLFLAVPVGQIPTYSYILCGLQKNFLKAAPQSTLLSPCCKSSNYISLTSYIFWFGFFIVVTGGFGVCLLFVFPPWSALCPSSSVDPGQEYPAGWHQSQDKVVKVLQARAESNSDSILGVPNDTQSLGALLAWPLQLTPMGQLWSHAPRCQFTGMLFPGSLALKKVKVVAELAHKYIESVTNTVNRCAVDGF